MPAEKHILVGVCIAIAILSILFFYIGNGRKNFTKVGVKKDWISSQGNFKDEILYQLIND